MELVLVLVVVAVGALIYFNRSARTLDINQDGKVDAADAVAVRAGSLVPRGGACLGVFLYPR